MEDYDWLWKFFLSAILILFTQLSFDQVVLLGFELDPLTKRSFHPFRNIEVYSSANSCSAEASLHDAVVSFH